MKMINLIILILIMTLLSISVNAVVYDWVGGQPVQSNNDNFTWAGGQPYIIMNGTVEAGPDTAPPSFGTITDNSSTDTTNSTDVQINITLTDSTNVDFYTLTTNDSSGFVWTNETLIDVEATTVNVIWNYSIENFPTTGGTLGVRFWTNDTGGYANVSSIHTITVQAVVTDTCTPTAGQVWTIEHNCTKSELSFHNPDYPVNIKDGSLVLKDYSNLTAKYINISHNKYVAFNKSSNSRYNRTGNP